MPELHIAREHTLGLAAARQAAQRWVQEAEGEWGMQCRRVSGRSQDEIHFQRNGVSGCLRVSGQKFELDVQLGFLLGPLTGQIERQIRQSLDELLGGAH